MVDIKYENGEIKVTVDDLSKIYSKDELPLKLEICKTVSQKVLWSCDLNSFTWATFPNPEMHDVIIRTQKDIVIYHYGWDPIQNGTFHYKILWLYCNKLISHGIRPSGIAIGTHDGEFGEWVPIALTNKSDILLVEGSKAQYDSLFKNFGWKPQLKLLNTIVTPMGGEVEFFEGGKGYTNTVVERVIRAWETEEVHSTKRDSISINDLLRYNSLPGEKFDWIHMDVEGLDAKLIMSIDYSLLPDLIIFEDNNLFQEEKDEIYEWLKARNYSLHSESGICSASKII